eukprot:1195331-Prorocentrum_minimum.AAC.5
MARRWPIRKACSPMDFDIDFDFLDVARPPSRDPPPGDRLPVGFARPDLKSGRASERDRATSRKILTLFVGTVSSISMSQNHTVNSPLIVDGCRNPYVQYSVEPIDRVNTVSSFTCCTCYFNLKL